jgi:hypothetical protein
MAHYLIVVSREDPALFSYLEEERFADDPHVTVLLDRRRAEGEVTPRNPYM